MDLRPVLYITGILLCTLAGGMIFPVIADLIEGNPDWQVFALSMIFTAFLGGALILTNAQKEITLSVKQTIVLTTFSWLALSLMAAMPFALSSLNMSYTDAFFESVSGITTTGGTVITGLDNTAPGILLWRSMLQWLGGIGIILMAMSVMPFLKVGGMQLFQIELSENEKATPRLARMASSIGVIYVGLTLMCAVLYHLAGMTTFDSIAHALTTISTGGFSTHDSSFTYFNSLSIEAIAVTFMILGCLPFILFVKTLSGNWGALFKDTQVKAFLWIIAITTTIMIVYLVAHDHETLDMAVRRGAFNIISLMTGTGFVNGDYNAWGHYSNVLLLFVMFIGGCAGSTTCGIKIFRFQVIYSVTIAQLRQLIHPHGVFTPVYNRKPLPKGVAQSVMSFFFIFALSFIFLTIGLSFVGLDFLTAISGAATSIANVGPGLGEIIGATGTFEPLPDPAKWMMCAGMLLGRLEILTVLVLFTRQFWSR